jgi:predicted nucleic-acid-binding Zn-ribbon protein
MKGTHVCPKCRHRKVWVINPVDLARQIPHQFDPVKLAQLKLGHLRDVKTDAPVHGFEAYVCARCGFTECYATTFEHIEKAGTLVDAEPGDIYR